MKQIQWFPGHMQKAKREVLEKIKLVDIIFEVVDSRLPFSSRNHEVQKMASNKPILMLLNKSNLADKNETKKWIKYYENMGIYTLEIDAIDGNNINNILTKSKQILAPMLEKEKAKGLKPRAIRAIILGIPNVGKSTLINKLAKRKAAQVGDRPGVTKAQQWIKVSDEFELLDTPGILMPKLESEMVKYSLALSGAIKDDVLPLDDVCIYGFKYLDKYYKEEFKARYQLGDYDIENILSIYEKIAKLRGCYKNKEIDYDRVNRLFLHDLRNKMIGNVTLDRYDEFIQL